MLHLPFPPTSRRPDRYPTDPKSVMDDDIARVSSHRQPTGTYRLARTAGMEVSTFRPRLVR